MIIAVNHDEWLSSKIGIFKLTKSFLYDGPAFTNKLLDAVRRLLCKSSTRI